MGKTKKKLRLSENRVLAGVVGGFAEYLGIDKTLLRVIYAAFVLFTGFFPGVFFYIIAWIIMKSADNDDVIDVKGQKK